MKPIVIPAFLALLAFGAGVADAQRTKGQNVDAPKPIQEMADAKAALSAAFTHLMAGDYGDARALASPLAEAGDADAQHMIAYLDENGLGGPQDLSSAISGYARAASAGSTDSQFALGELAFQGVNAKQDYERAAGWYRLAALKKHAGAQARLGLMHQRGWGVARDRAVAISLFEKAAASGDASAQYYLGGAYLTGDIVAKDAIRAAGFFEKAAGQGHVDAQYNLALLYDSDLLGPPDREKTKVWMLSAAEGGLPSAAVALGLMAHEAGPIEGAGAADWFFRAAEAGDPQGQFLYAIALSEGDGRDRNISEAILWVDRVLAAEGDLPPDLLANAEGLRAKLTEAAQH